jgi:glycosyltransferase involved in cell wall biosynthesis
MSPPLLSVVVPVFNQAASITENLQVVRERIAANLQDEFEVVVVSDGSIDATEDALVAAAAEGAFRVFHYDRNLGKGYAVKLGALEARGRWIAFVDADLDLDPGSIPAYVRRAEERGLDFAIGSKRHPDSDVHYPRSRVVASWLFQQVVRLLFRLNVRDTQVGLKVFSRDVAEQVLPLLFVKRYAFDIELLAVARAFGFDKIEEQPIRLDYRFTGSGVRSRAVIRALVDTAAIFYRLRILHYYQRRRRFSGAYGFTRPRSALPSVSVLLPEGTSFRERDFPAVQVIELPRPDMPSFLEAARSASGQVVALIEPGARAASNWLSATVPFLVRDEVAAVVTPKLAPLSGSTRARAAASIDESRVGAGLGYFRYTPGNVRFVDDFPAVGIVVRRDVLLEMPPDISLAQLVGALAASGHRVLYTPEAVVVADPPPLFAAHLRTVRERARLRGARLRRGHVKGTFAVVVLAVVLVALLVIALVVDAGLAVALLAVLAALYFATVCVAAAAATFRFGSLAVGGLTLLGLVATHLVYVAGVVRGSLAG